MALMLIKKILDSKNNEQLIDGSIVVDPASGKSVLAQSAEIAESLAALKTTINDFLTGEDNDGDIDRLSELVKAINANKESIDALVMDNLSVDDLVDSLTSDATDKALAAAQGKALKALIDALDASVTEKLDKFQETGDGDLEYNGKVLDGSTSVAIVASTGATPVFDEKLILVATPFTTPSEDQGE